MSPFEYAPAPESRAVVDIASSYGLFIGGEFVDATGGRAASRRSTRPPRRCSPTSPTASADDVDRAVKAARTASTPGLGR